MSINPPYISWQEKARAIFCRPYKRHVLETSLFLETIPDLNRLHLLPRAEDGSTRVYYGTNTVIKKTNNAFERFKNMQEVRRVAEWLGTTHLSIPQARIFKGDLLEKRLPIQSTKQIWQTGFYLEHKEELEKAILDFSKLYMQQIGLDDLVHFDGNIRCDNAPFFVDRDGKYKIALVDLEKVSKTSIQSPTKKLATLVGFFPKHYDVLLKTFKSEETPDLLSAKIQGLERLSKYRDYVNYIAKKGITIENAELVPRPSSKELQEIALSLQKKHSFEPGSENLFSVFALTLFDEMQKEYLPRLSKARPLKNCYDFLPLRFIETRLTPWENKARQCVNHPGFMNDFLKELKARQLIHEFAIIADVWEGEYFMEITF